MRKMFHDWVVKKLIGSGCFTAKDIDTEKRTVYCGMFGLKTIFIGPKEQFYLSVLVKWYRYQLFEGTIRLHSTWGEPIEKVHNDYDQFSAEFNKAIYDSRAAAGTADFSNLGPQLPKHKAK